eukprot:Nk52_evm16s248 gene=Nk52_evmTU16s248
MAVSGADKKSSKPEVKTINLSDIKCKAAREKAYALEKARKKKEKKASRQKRKREEEQLGDAAPPKQIPRTIENTREFDETVVDPEDEEVQIDEESDEFADYFKGRIPKILITTSRKPVGETFKFARALLNIFPNSHFYARKVYDLKEITEYCKERGFTDMIVINEDRKEPNRLIISHLPNGPTAVFKLSSIKYGETIKGHGRQTDHRPELILNNFNTRLGHSVGRMIAALLPHNPEFSGRRAVTFHNQRDFIFFRQHRYIFKSEKKAGLQEIGPRFTLKLKSLQKGTFNSKFGEYEWLLNRKDMETSRRKFFL